MEFNENQKPEHIIETVGEDAKSFVKDNENGLKALAILAGILLINKRMVSKSAAKAVARVLKTHQLNVAMDDAALKAAVTEAVQTALRRY